MGYSEFKGVQCLNCVWSELQIRLVFGIESVLASLSVPKDIYSIDIYRIEIIKHTRKSGFNGTAIKGF